MNESLKVQPHHLERGAYLYVRQSSMRQVVENVESTKRQYALRARATALGWPDGRVVVIDSDQGESGASAAWREGFQRLVTDVGMGRAGIVMGLEVSRLARNNADWHRLLEICALAETLILDEDGTASRERKRMLAHIIEDVTLIKMQTAESTKIHVRFKGGKTETLTTLNPKSSAQQVKTPSQIVTLVDRLLDDHVYSEIADLLNEQGYSPGGSARPGRRNDRFTSLRVAYLVHRYGIRSRYDRLRDRGMLTTTEMVDCLGIHELTLISWAKHGIVTRHPYNGHAYLYEHPGPNPPTKQCSRWNQLVDRAAVLKLKARQSQDAPIHA